MKNLMCNFSLVEDSFIIERDNLYLSEVVFNAAKKVGVESSLQMVSYNSVFPDAFPSLLGWSEERVNSFMTAIEPFHSENSDFQRGYGALGPK